MSDHNPLYFGLPMYVNPAVPHDAVFVRVAGDIKRVLDLTKAEKVTDALRDRVEALETAIQRIRIVSSNTNPMKPELVVMSGEEIDRLCREALTRPAPKEKP